MFRYGTWHDLADVLKDASATDQMATGEQDQYMES